LYGSRARGERHEESDVDLLVIVREDGDRYRDPVREAWDEVGWRDDRNHFLLATHIFDLAYLRNRREIKSFFMQKVDRDKIVLYGSKL
jgi:predicted nucleotidyltransferase